MRGEECTGVEVRALWKDGPEPDSDEGGRRRAGLGAGRNRSRLAAVLILSSREQYQHFCCSRRQRFD